MAAAERPTNGGLPRTSVHGMPRIGAGRELKWGLESYWRGESSGEELEQLASRIRQANWRQLSSAGIDLVPCNDFSLYDHVLDAAVAVGAVPRRFGHGGGPVNLETYFAMARGSEADGRAVRPLELTKWFDTNYHYLVPELEQLTGLSACPSKIEGELSEARTAGVSPKPVLVGPLSFLLLGRPDFGGMEPLAAVEALLASYQELLAVAAANGAEWIQLDEPVLVADRPDEELSAFAHAYRHLGERGDRPKIVISSYFGQVGPAMSLLRDLPVEGVGLDLCQGRENLDLLRAEGGLGSKALFAGVVDGRSVWAADLRATLELLGQLDTLCGGVVVSSSCSLMHLPASLVPETELDPELRSWLSFAEEKLKEVAILARALHSGSDAISAEIESNAAVLDSRMRSARVRDPSVRERVAESLRRGARRPGTVGSRRPAQASRLGLPVLPSTTIGSFPQTSELRAARSAHRRGSLGSAAYRARIREEIDRVIALQEAAGLDVLVHGEPERDDMVRYFAEQLSGFAVTAQGWVQSYGSRCVRPTIIYGDVARPEPMTLEWTRYAQSRTSRPVKAILTGPVTMLQWSFVRDDQPRQQTAFQIGVAIGDELRDLVALGSAVVQVDEPAFPEALPLRRSERTPYLDWATTAFRLATEAATEDTQLHTHMCYAELGEIVDALADLEVDVVSLEAARSQMSLVGHVADSTFEGQVGPGVYDVHSPRVPTSDEMAQLLAEAARIIGPGRVWANPDCGLKTRSYEEVGQALRNLVEATRSVRETLASGARPTGGA